MLKALDPENSIQFWTSFALSRDRDTPWTLTELQTAFRFLLETRGTTVKFCFFIDGLDELEGDKSNLISFTRSVGEYPHLKFCISSRPWMIFEDEFNSKPHLMLQDLTFHDIKLFVDSELSSSVAFKEPRIMDEIASEFLIQSVSEKASGVFLWVVLVVRSLMEGLRDGDRLPDLQRRLDSLPPELDDLFRTILHHFDRRLIKQASALFQMVKASPSPLSLLCLSLADEEDAGLATRQRVEPSLFFPRQRFYRALNMRRRPDSRCKGLLETGAIWVKADALLHPRRDYLDPADVVAGRVDSVDGILRSSSAPPVSTGESDMVVLRDYRQLPPEYGDLLANADVEYLHRTVKDFLDPDDIWQEISSATDPDFDPHLALARSYLHQLKCVHYNFSVRVPEGTWNAIFWVLEFASLAEAKGTSQVALLDELAKYMARFFPRTTQQTNPPIQDTVRWPIEPPGPPTDFMHLAVQCGLRLYVERKLGQTQPGIDYVRSLLETSVSRYSTKYTRPKGPPFLRDRPRRDIAESLMAHGRILGHERQRWLQKIKACCETLLPASSAEEADAHDDEGDEPYLIRTSYDMIALDRENPYRQTLLHNREVVANFGTTSLAPITEEPSPVEASCMRTPAAASNTFLVSFKRRLKKLYLSYLRRIKTPP